MLNAVVTLLTGFVTPDSSVSLDSNDTAKIGIGRLYFVHENAGGKNKTARRPLLPGFWPSDFQRWQCLTLFFTPEPPLVFAIRVRYLELPMNT